LFNSIKPINFKKMSPLKSGILNFLFFFMRLSCKINFPLLSAFIIYLSLRRIKKIKYHPKNKLTLLVLHKEGGIDDLTCAYQNRISKINYLNLHRKFIKIIFHNFFEKKIYDYDYNYYDRDIVLNKKKYFTYLRNVIFYLKKIKKFNGFINFNIFYYSEVELQKACKSENLKFFSIHKEGLHPPEYLKCLKWIYTNTSNNFYGDKVFIYNNFEKKNLITSKVCKPKQIVVVGMPRLNQSFAIRQNDILNSKEIKNIIIYQSQERFLPYRKNKNFKKPQHPLFDFKLPYSLEETEIKCIKVLKKISKIKNIKLTVKCRTGQNISRFKNVYKNLNVISGGAGHKHLIGNQIVIAFNSTIIFEALAAGKIVFTPIFVKSYKKNSTYFFNLFNTTLIDKNKKSFEKNIIKIIENKNYRKKYQDSKKIKRLLKIYLNNSDNQSGERLVKSLEKFA
tara:strand:+ start:2860 stop:4209 length:1350 start_codon:yes stop_codon:yes gene_type:complete